MPFRNLKPGDQFQRMIQTRPFMKMEVVSVDDKLIHARAVGGPGGYTFCRDTGVEEDEYLGWGVKFGVTGTFIDRNDADAVAEERDTG